MAKRSCRRTTDENLIHKKAVEMRKKTDEQLVHYVEDRVEKARSEGFNCGKASVPKTGEGAKEFIAFLQLNKIPGNWSSNNKQTHKGSGRKWILISVR